MSVLLCRCCGARLEIRKEMSVCKCDYCGVLQTIPILDFDEKALLWERADELHRSGEYERALSLYEQIVQMSPDDPDIYWAKVLCTYGVEYVEEPISHKRVPTINKIQYTSVIDNEDYRRAVKLAANGDQRRIYILEAQKLEELRERILSVSLNEKPYDIFICYKETDSSGRRTEDSVLAAGLYKVLSAEGWRVFFSRVTLESKAGMEYEPYIFAALNSARLMLVVGTSPENINAVWVRNEWSRYLARMTEKGEGTLVALYKGMLKEHLPQEFSHVQAVDMSAPDFQEELIRGIRKILAKSPSEAVETAAPNPISDVSGMLRRAELFLEDGDFMRADELCENALDCEPENAQAYLIKLLAQFHIADKNLLYECTEDFTTSGNYAKILRFGDEAIKSWLENETALFREKAAALSAQRIAAEREQAYLRAAQLIQTANNKQMLLDAQSILRGLVGYKDSDSLLTRCEAMIKAFEEEQIRRETQRLAEEQAHSLHNKKMRRIVAIACTSAACLITIIGVSVKIGKYVTQSSSLNKAESYLESGDYDEAIALFSELKRPDKVAQTTYEKACALAENGEFDEAESLFRSLSVYSDSKERLTQTMYSHAKSLFDSGDFGEAQSLFVSLGGYADSKEFVLRSGYSAAELAESGGRFEEAAKQFSVLGEYSDSPERADECRYKNACKLANTGDYQAAIAIFTDLGGYKDSTEKLPEMNYRLANKYLAAGQYDEAITIFTEFEDYSDSAEMIESAYLEKGKSLLSRGYYTPAIEAFESAGNSTETDDYITEANYLNAGVLCKNGEYTEALTIYEKLGGYKDCRELAKNAKYHFAVQLRETGYYDDAIKQFSELGSYSDAAAQIKETENAKRRDVKQGDVITFGGWVQGKNGEYLPLEWIVLKRDGDRALVTTKYLVDFMPYGALCWKDSEVRNWLGTTFYNGAFSQQNKKAIAETVLIDSNKNITTDRVFILSKEEAFTYLTRGTLRTDYSEWGEKKLEQAVKPTLKPGVSYARWFGDPYWLRDIGNEMRVCSVDSMGGFDKNTLYTDGRIGIRPAMWIELGEY
ncbi:MAG: tetratricopeptide repeat protein [Oscillospiraceae bacterium]